MREVDRFEDAFFRDNLRSGGGGNVFQKEVAFSLAFPPAGPRATDKMEEEDGSFPLGFTHLGNCCFPPVSEGQSPPLCEKGSKTHWVLDHFSFFSAALCGMWDPSSATRARTHAHCSRNAVLTTYQGRPPRPLFLCFLFFKTQRTFQSSHFSANSLGTIHKPGTKVGNLGIFTRRLCKK